MHSSGYPQSAGLDSCCIWDQGRFHCQHLGGLLQTKACRLAAVVSVPNSKGALELGMKHCIRHCFQWHYPYVLWDLLHVE